MDPKFTKKDPFQAREAERYDKPIVSREFILEHLDQLGKPANLRQLIRDFELVDEDEQEGLRRRLKAMERDGQLMRNRKGAYALIDELELIPGRVIGHRDGFGFVKPDDGSDDLFLSARQMQMAFDGDQVLVREISQDRRGRREGIIVEVVARKTENLVGRYFVEDGVGFVVPSNHRIAQDILVPEEGRGEAKSGQIVLVAIRHHPTMRKQAVGQVIEVIGDFMGPGMEIEVAIRSFGIPYQWEDEVSQELRSFSTDVKEEDIKGRKDLRDLPLVTIDGEDAKDFDDAVYAESRKKGWTLYVAIADVSHYVTPGSPLDVTAEQRGNSVYFPGRVVPMLPEVLSNGLCSLKPNVDRLAMVCEIKIDKQGEINSFQFYEAIIHSHARMTYENVAKILIAKDKKITKQYQDLVPHFEVLYDLYQVLAAARKKRGAIDFNTVETSFVLDKKRKVKKIVPVQRNDAHRLIEECMIAANVCAATFLSKAHVPALYRIHKGPDAEKVKDLKQLLKDLGLRLTGGKEPTPKDFSQLIGRVQERPDFQMLQTMVLRSLSQAEYNPDNIGHFGLALKTYGHFTSPIRRYPDLLVHRGIRHLLTHQKQSVYDDCHAEHHRMGQYGSHCSMTERRADDATRYVESWLKCQFLEDKVGQCFDGIITGVTDFGVFVQLKSIYVEGLVHITSLRGDYYHFDRIHASLIGKHTGTKYHIGDELRVIVARVDLDQQLIDFELVDS